MKKTLLTLIVAFAAVIAFAQETGLASFYHDKFEGKTTASGETFHQDAATAAHRTLPFGTRVRVTNLDNNLWADVTINDRGPFAEGRVIDLTRSVAKKLQFIEKGTTKVKVEVLDANGNVKTEAKADAPKSETKTADKSETKADKTPEWPGAKKDKSVKETEPTATDMPEANYYKMQSTRVKASGYGVQVASYQEVANLLEHYISISQRVDHDCLIQVTEVADRKVYRVIVGPFDSREKAEQFKRKLSDFDGCYIIQL